MRLRFPVSGATYWQQKSLLSIQNSMSTPHSLQFSRHGPLVLPGSVAVPSRSKIPDLSGAARRMVDVRKFQATLQVSIALSILLFFAASRQC